MKLAIPGPEPADSGTYFSDGMKYLGWQQSDRSSDLRRGDKPGQTGHRDRRRLITDRYRVIGAPSKSPSVQAPRGTGCGSKRRTHIDPPGLVTSVTRPGADP
jgi:hypothetical protein